MPTHRSRRRPSDPEAAPSSPQITRVILYVKDLEVVAQFYERHFGLCRSANDESGWMELAGDNGCGIALHKAAVSQKSGAAMKLVFGVKDVAKYRSRCARRGLKFGPIHRANGIEFANAKDPAGNSISISNRGVSN